MKQIQPYLPAILIAVAGVAALYFFWYKPKKDKEAAEIAAKQAEYDAALLADDPMYIKLKNMKVTSIQQSTANQTSAFMQ